MSFFWEFFSPALADGFSLEFEWHQVSSSHQDTSQYSDRSEHCCSLYFLYFSSYIQVLQFTYPSFGDRTKSINYNWYNVPQITFQFPSKIQILLFLKAFFQFYHVVFLDSKIHKSASSLSLLTIIRCGRPGEFRWSVLISQFQSIFLQILVYVYAICSYGQIWASCPPSCV